MQMPGESRTAASAEIQSDVEAMRFDCQRQGFLRFPDEFGHLKKFGVVCLVEVGNVPGRCDEYMAVIIGKAVQYDDAFVRSPEYEVLVVLLRMIIIMADKALVLIGDSVAVFFGLRFLVQALDIFDSPRCP